MKTNHTNEQLQDAIDAACVDTRLKHSDTIGGTLYLRDERNNITWDREKFARLHLLKNALERLPEPPPPNLETELGATPGSFAKTCNDPKTGELPTPEVVISEPWTPKVGDANPVQDMALGGQMYWRDLARQLAETWWKCHNIGASLQHGDIDTDVSFSIVCEKHGGQVFHADTPHNAWLKAEKWLMSPDRANFPLATLQPA